jgi:O-antigen/teichoic acid export membrane protein
MSSQEFGKRVARGFAWNHVYKIFDYGMYFMFTVSVVRMLGPAAAAPFVVYLSIAFPIALVGSLGVDSVLLRFMSRLKQDGSVLETTDLTELPLVRFITRLFSFRVLVAIVLSLLIFVCLVALPAFIPAMSASLGTLPQLAPYLILFTFAQAATAFAQFALIGLLQVKKVFLASVIARSLLVGGMFALFLSGQVTVPSAVIVHVVSVFVNAIFLVYWMWQSVEHPTPNDSRHRATRTRGVLVDLGNFFRRPSSVRLFMLTPVMMYGITAWGADMLSTVLGRQPDVVMIRIFFGEHSRLITDYQVATNFLLMAEYVVLFGFSGALVSVFSSLGHQDEQDLHRDGLSFPRLNRARREVSAFQTVAIVPICAFTMAFARQLVLFIYGKEFVQAAPILQVGILMLAFNITVFSGGVQITSLITIGKERLVFRYRLLWAVINVVANFFLIQQYGAMGALLGTQLSNIGACGCEFFFAKRYVGAASDWKNSFVVVAISSCCAWAAYVLINTFLADTGLFWQLAFGSMISLGGCAACYAVLRVDSARRIYLKIRSTLFPGVAQGGGVA